MNEKFYELVYVDATGNSSTFSAPRGRYGVSSRDHVDVRFSPIILAG